MPPPTITTRACDFINYLLKSLPNLARFPARWNYLAEKDSRQINMLEQILIAKVFNPGSGPGQAFGGICSGLAPGIWARPVMGVHRLPRENKDDFTGIW